MKTQSVIRHIQTETSAKVRSANRSGNLFQAIVVDVFYDRVGVQLGTDGSFLRGLKLIGGPVEAGDAVQVDFSVDPPLVIAKGNKYLSQSDLDAAIEKLSNTQGVAGTKIEIVHFSGGAVVNMYPPSSDGLTQVLGVATDGDVIWLPDVRISGDFTVGDGVTLAGVSSRESLLFGTVTLGENSTLENIKVVAVSHYDDALAVQVNAIELRSLIKNCEIHAYQCVAGNSVAVKIAANGLLDVSYSMIVGCAKTGTGHGFEFVAGSSVELSHTRIFGKTAWYTGTGSVEEFSITDGFSESEIWCGPTGTTFFPNYDGSGIFSAPMRKEKKVGTVPLVVSSSTLLTSSSSMGAESFCRNGNYLYFKTYIGGVFKVREVKISDGSYIEMNFPTGATSVMNGQFAVVEERKIVVPGITGTNIKIYILDFSNSSTTEVHSFTTVDPPIGGDPYFPNTAWSYEVGTPLVTKNNSGDTVIVISGPSSYDVYTGFGGVYNFKTGTYFLTKNWTQNGSWEMHHSVLFDDETHWNGQVQSGDTLGASFVVGNYIIRKVVVNKFWTDFDYVAYPEYEITGCWLIFYIYNIETGVMTSAYYYGATGTTWGGFFSVSGVGIDHTENCFYINSWPDVVTPVATIWKLSISSAELAIHHTAESDQIDYAFVWNNGRCLVVMYNEDGSETILDADTFDLYNSEPAIQDNLYNIGDAVFDENGYVWLIDDVNDLIIGYKLEDSTSINFDPGVTITDITSRAWCLGDVFIIKDNDSPSHYVWYLIRSA